MNKLSPQQKAELEAKIREAVPEKEGGNTSMQLDGVFTGIINYRDKSLNLQDCALAIREVGSSDLHDCPDGGSHVAVTLFDLYDLTSDYSGQSEEFYQFLYSLLIMTDQQTIERLGYKDCSKIAEWYGCSTADIQKMIAHEDWSIWRRLEEKVMEDEEGLWGKLGEKFDNEPYPNQRFANYMESTLPERCKALCSVLSSSDE